MNLLNGLFTGSVKNEAVQIINLDTDYVGGLLYLNKPISSVSAAALFNINYEDLVFSNINETKNKLVSLIFKNTGANDVVVKYAATEVFRINAGEIKTLLALHDGAGVPTFQAGDVVNLDDATTTCSNNSMFYANAGQVDCTGSVLTFDGTTLGGTSEVNLTDGTITTVHSPSNGNAYINYTSGANSITAEVNANRAVSTATDGSNTTDIRVNKTGAASLSSSNGANIAKFDISSANVLEMTTTDGTAIAYHSSSAASSKVHFENGIGVISEVNVDAAGTLVTSTDGTDTASLGGSQTVAIVSASDGANTASLSIDKTLIEARIADATNTYAGFSLYNSGDREEFSQDTDDYYIPTGGITTGVTDLTKKLRRRAQTTGTGNTTITAASFAMPDSAACSARIRGVVMIQRNGAAECWSTSVERSVRRTGAATFDVQLIGGETAYSGGAMPTVTFTVDSTGATINVKVAANFGANTYTINADLEIFIVYP